MADLLGGTTGQVLAKASNTDMDFSWVAQDDSNAIQNAIVDAKGDLIGATAADTPARLAVGANGTMLVANSAESTGLKWTTATDQFPWQTWSPSYTRLTIGNGTVVARYQQIGKTVNFFWRLVWGSTTSVVNYPVISVPVNAAYANDFNCGPVTLLDSGTNSYSGLVQCNGTGFVPYSLFLTGSNQTSGVITDAAPFTHTTGDIWTITGTYEAA
jgi:hypothetical protein